MDLDLVINIIEENGYIGLFLWMWFGISLIPLPNEMILMTVGLASSMGALNPFVTLLVSYCGIVAALTTSYVVGTLLGRRLLQFLQKRKRLANRIESSLRMMKKYHAFSLALSCFIPGARYLVPLLYGFSRLSYRTFAIFSYSGALVWVSIVFVLGYLFGDKIDAIVKYNETIWLFALMAAAAAGGYILFRRKKAKETNLKNEFEIDRTILHERRHD
jgi:membrane-associated protein